MNDLASGLQVQQANPQATLAAQVTQWLAQLCAVLPRVERGVVVLGEPEVGPFAPVAFWPGAGQGASDVADVAEQALAERRVTTAPLPGGAMGLALPVEADHTLRGVVAFALAGYTETNLQPVLQRLSLAMPALVELLRREQQAESLDAQGRLMGVLDVLGAVLDEGGFEPACRTLVTELATRLQCDRVSLGVVRRGHAEIIALSHSAQMARRMNLMHAIGAAMDEAIDQRALVRYPSQSGDELVVDRDHGRLAQEHGSGSLLTVPMAGRDGFAGALLFERPASQPFTRADLAFAQACGAALGRILEMARRNERALLLRILDATRTQIGRLIGPRYVLRKLLVTGVLAAMAFFSVAQGDYRVTAPATLEGAVRRTVAAPFDGYVATAPARAGDLLRADDVLATLDDSEIRLERLKWASQYAQYVRQHQEAVANRDRAKAQIGKSQYEQAQAQVSLLDTQLRRATIVAPFDGVVVKGDLSQSLGSAVKRGDTLFEITPLDAYRVIVNVDERDIADVVSGQRGVLILASIVRDAFPFVVGNVTAVTTARDGRNFFRVEALLERTDERLRPGMEGVAKIDIEQRRLWWIWTHRLENWIRLFVWTYWP